MDKTKLVKIYLILLLIDWLRVLQSILKKSGIDIDETERIFIQEHNYFMDLAILLEVVPTELITHYVHMNFISQAYQFIEQDSESNRIDRWQECASLSDLVGVLSKYVSTHNINEKRSNAQKVFDDINEYLTYGIMNNWRNSSAKELAKYELAKTYTVIAYPDWINDHSYIENYYGNMKTGSTHFMNMINFKGFAMQRKFRLLKNRNELRRYQFIKLLDTDDLIFFVKDDLVWSPTYLISSKYGLSAPRRAMSYSTLGFEYGFIWSEVLNDVGRRLFANNIVAERAHDCLYGQLNTTIKNDIIAKTGSDAEMAFVILNGLHAAYASWNAKRNDNRITKLSGMEEINEDQIFFLTFASHLCSSKFQDVLEGHSLDLNFILSNMPEFSAAYQCPEDSLMNRQNKCRIL